MRTQSKQTREEIMHALQASGMFRPVYLVGQVAKVLQVGRSTIYRMIAEGKIDTIQGGPGVRITLNALLDYLEGR